jgi:NADPH:quinone reductase-like Zn-dependent oxidoreductase
VYISGDAGGVGTMAIGGDDLAGAFAIVKPGGKVVSIAGVPESAAARRDLGAGPMLAALFWLAGTKPRRQARQHHVTYRPLMMRPSGDDLSFLAQLADKRVLEVVTDRIFPFDQIADAFAYLEQGRAHGKVVVQMV